MKYSNVEELKNSMKIILDMLSELLEKLTNLKTNIQLNTYNKNIFLEEMDEVYKKLTENSELSQWLQGFSFKEFLQWNQINHEINSSNNSPLKRKELKLKRDMEFLPTLLKTCYLLKHTIGKTLDKIKFSKP